MTLIDQLLVEQLLVETQLQTLKNEYMSLDINTKVRNFKISYHKFFKHARQENVC